MTNATQTAGHPNQCRYHVRLDSATCRPQPRRHHLLLATDRPKMAIAAAIGGSKGSYGPTRTIIWDNRTAQIVGRYHDGQPTADNQIDLLAAGTPGGIVRD